MAAAQRRPLVAGNWKMNGVKASAAEFARMIQGSAGLSRCVDLLVCPPALYMAQATALTAGSGIAVGGQDCHTKQSGAHTGEESNKGVAHCVSYRRRRKRSR